jgi:hypothetical protein
VNFVYFFQLYFSKGTDTTNKYGEPSDFKFLRKKRPYNVFKSEKILRETNNLGEFTTKDFPIEDRDKKFYFYEYCKPDGEWIEKNEPICEIRIGESAGFMFKSGKVIASKSGVLEWMVEKDWQLVEKTIFYRLHEKGVYEKENKIENDEYKHYFLFGESERSFTSWLVSDGDFVNKGDEIYKYKDSKYNVFIHKAEKDGYIHIVDLGKIYSIKKNKLLYYIRNQDNQRIVEKYQNIPSIIIDDFTQNKSIVWNRVSTWNRLGYGIVTKSDNGLMDLNFSFNYLQNEDKIVFHFNPKQISPKQNDKVSLVSINLC